MILLCEHQPVLGAKVPNQPCGLAIADQGHPRAALDTNDFWIRGVWVRSIQYSRMADLHAAATLALPCLLVAAMQILFARTRRVSGHEFTHAEDRNETV